MPETNTAIITLNEDGLVVVRVRQGLRQSLDDAKANVATAVAVGGDRRRPVLIDIRHAEPLDAEVRHYYTGAVVDGFRALAMLVEGSPVGRMMGNVYLRLAGAGIPTKLFTDESQARAWLIQHRQ